MSEIGKWDIIVSPQTQRVLRRLPRDVLQRIDQAFSQLALDARPPGCKKLAGYDNLYRLRAGDWRISYAIEDDRLVILILEIAPPGSAYRHL